MVGHPVDDDLHAPFVGACHEGVEVGERAEHGVHIGVVGHVVSEVGHRGGIEGRDPQGVDAERAGQVVELGGDTGQIADPVPVRVHEAAGIDLVEDGFLPPLVRHRCLQETTRYRLEARVRNVAGGPAVRVELGRCARGGR